MHLRVNLNVSRFLLVFGIFSRIASVTLLPFNDLILSGSQFLSIAFSYNDDKESSTFGNSTLANNKSISMFLYTILITGGCASFTKMSFVTSSFFFNIFGRTPKKCFSL